MALGILLGILGILALVFLENFLIAFLGFRFTVIVFLLLFKKVNWKVLLLIFFVMFIIFDIANSYALGTNILIFSISLGLFVLGSAIFSNDSPLSAFFLGTFVFVVYNILFALFPSFLLTGEFGFVVLNDFISSFIKAVISAGLLIVMENIFTNFRGRGNSSKIQLK